VPHLPSLPLHPLHSAFVPPRLARQTCVKPSLSILAATASASNASSVSGLFEGGRGAGGPGHRLCGRWKGVEQAATQRGGGLLRLAQASRHGRAPGGYHATAPACEVVADGQLPPRHRRDPERQLQRRHVRQARRRLRQAGLEDQQAVLVPRQGARYARRGAHHRGRAALVPAANVRVAVALKAGAQQLDKPGLVAIGACSYVARPRLAAAAAAAAVGVAAPRCSTPCPAVPRPFVLLLLLLLLLLRRRRRRRRLLLGTAVRVAAACAGLPSRPCLCVPACLQVTLVRGCPPAGLLLLLLGVVQLLRRGGHRSRVFGRCRGGIASRSGTVPALHARGYAFGERAVPSPATRRQRSAAGGAPHCCLAPTPPGEGTGPRAPHLHGFPDLLRRFGRVRAGFWRRQATGWFSLTI
jgi:hypothetical protein